MKPLEFAADVARKPEKLRGLAELLGKGNPWTALPHRPERVILLGMGTSSYAANWSRGRCALQD
jgi:hypothetical protein